MLWQLLVRSCVFSCFIFPSVVGFSLPFEVTAKTTLPTEVPQDGSVYAFYTVKNNTTVTRLANTIKNLPAGVSQVTSDGFYLDTCDSTFDLNPRDTTGDSCTLQLLITSAVNGFPHPFVCFQGSSTSCVGTKDQLSVQAITLTSMTWQSTNLTQSNYLSDLAIADNTLYAGGLAPPTAPLLLNVGQLWALTTTVNQPNDSWSAQYAAPKASAQVSGIIPNATSQLLYMVAGTASTGKVNSFTPGATAPTNISGDITTQAAALNDLSLGENNVLYVTGGTKNAFPSLGEVWAWDGVSHWTSTGLQGFRYAPDFP